MVHAHKLISFQFVVILIEENALINMKNKRRTNHTIKQKTRVMTKLRAQTVIIVDYNSTLHQRSA